MVEAPEVPKPPVRQRSLLNKGLSQSTGVLSLRGSQEELCWSFSSNFNSGPEDASNTGCPYWHKAAEPERKGNLLAEVDPKRKVWASSSDLLSSAHKVTERDHVGDSHRRNCRAGTVPVRTSAAARNKEGRYSDGSIALDVFGPQKPDQMRCVPETSTSAAISNAFDRIRQKQKKLQLLREAMNVEGQWIFLHFRVQAVGSLLQQD